MSLVIPDEEDYFKFLDILTDSACSGLNDCVYCQRKLYPRRRKHLTSWLLTYIEHRDQINKGELIIPKLSWVALDKAKVWKIEDVHQSSCSQNKDISDCDCKISYLLRAMYNNVKGNALSLGDQILPIYLKMAKRKNW